MNSDKIFAKLFLLYARIFFKIIHSLKRFTTKKGKTQSAASEMGNDEDLCMLVAHLLVQRKFSKGKHHQSKKLRDLGYLLNLAEKKKLSDRIVTMCSSALNSVFVGNGETIAAWFKKSSFLNCWTTLLKELGSKMSKIESAFYKALIAKITSLQHHWDNASINECSTVKTSTFIGIINSSFWSSPFREYLFSKNR